LYQANMSSFETLSDFRSFSSITPSEFITR
jgi:hypothetical protein